MGQNIVIKDAPLQVIRTVNDKLMSYNVEFTEVTGGTFWKAYTPEQIAGTEKFQVGGAAILHKQWLALCRCIHQLIYTTKNFVN